MYGFANAVENAAVSLLLGGFQNPRNACVEDFDGDRYPELAISFAGVGSTSTRGVSVPGRVRGARRGFDTLGRGCRSRVSPRKLVRTGGAPGTVTPEMTSRESSQWSSTAPRVQAELLLVATKPASIRKGECSSHIRLVPTEVPLASGTPAGRLVPVANRGRLAAVEVGLDDAVSPGMKRTPKHCSRPGELTANQLVVTRGGQTTMEGGGGGSPPAEEPDWKKKLKEYKDIIAGLF